MPINRSPALCASRAGVRERNASPATAATAVNPACFLCPKSPLVQEAELAFSMSLSCFGAYLAEPYEVEGIIFYGFYISLCNCP